tara:strand:- start:239 stop:901 length:663 start_codon:yes stop_codon:yes gene_type:complete
MFDIDIINFKSEPKQTFFAPEWNYYLFETNIDNINFNEISKLCLRKEKEIAKLPKSNKVSIDGFTGLGENSTTSKYEKYNVLKWKNKNIKLIKQTIIDFHNAILKHFNQPLLNELWIQCWVNIMRKGEQIKPHLHSTNPYTYLGGHICVQCEDTTTNYISPINQINMPELYKSKNSVGKLTLFQNNIPHYTSKHNSNKERITIAFDLSLNKTKNNYLRLI